MMQANAKWQEGFQSVVDNGRNHSLLIDLPKAKKGADQGPTALELVGMGLSGCVSTVFAVIADNSKVGFSALTVEMRDVSPPATRTIAAIDLTVRVKSDAEERKLRKVFDKTMATCSVGLLLEAAGVKIAGSLEIRRT